MLSNCAITGDMSLSSVKRGPAQPRLAQPRPLPPLYEAAPVWTLPVAPRARTNSPRRQARAFRSESQRSVQRCKQFIWESLVQQTMHQIRTHLIAHHTSPRVKQEGTMHMKHTRTHTPCTRWQTYNLLSGQMWCWRSFSSTTRDKKVLLKVSDNRILYNLPAVPVAMNLIFWS